MYQFFHTIEWTPGIGDPTFIGWFTVAAYLYCSYRCFCVFRKSSTLFKQYPLRQTRLWLFSAWFLLMLGINKQLDLQSLVTDIGRYVIQEEGLIAHKRQLQKIFIFTVGAIGVVAMVVLISIYRPVTRDHLLIITGLCTLTVFILVRASSFHDVDLFLGSQYIGIKMNWLLELSGIGLIWLNARIFLKLYQWRMFTQNASLQNSGIHND